MLRGALPLILQLGLVVTVSASSAGAECRWVEVQSWGRPGHGAALDLHSAPHRLIRALADLTAAGSEEWLERAEVVELRAGRTINVKPPTARARVRITLAPGAELDDDALRRKLTERLQPGAAPHLLAAPCPPGGERPGE